MSNLSFGSVVASLILAAFGAIGAGIGRIVFTSAVRNVSRLFPLHIDLKSLRVIWLGLGLLAVGCAGALVWITQASPAARAAPLALLAHHQGAVLASAVLLIAAALMAGFGRGIGKAGAVLCVLALGVLDYQVFVNTDLDAYGRVPRHTLAEVDSVLAKPPRPADLAKAAVQVPQPVLETLAPVSVAPPVAVAPPAAIVPPTVVRNPAPLRQEASLEPPVQPSAKPLAEIAPPVVAPPVLPSPEPAPVKPDATAEPPRQAPPTARLVTESPDQEIRIGAGPKRFRLARGAVYHLTSMGRKQSVVTVVSGRAAGWPASDMVAFCNQAPAALASGEPAFGVRWMRACSDDTIVDVVADSGQ